MSRIIIAAALAAMLFATAAAAQPPARKPPPPQPPSAAEVIDSVEGNPEVEAETKGQYPAMEREEALPLGQIQHAWDTAPAGAGVYSVAYAPDQIIRVRVRQYMPTTIVFPAWESFSAPPLLGDAFAFEAGWAAPGKLAIRAKQIGSDSAVTLFGDSGNVYAFYLRAEGANSRNVPDVLVYVDAAMPMTVLERLARESPSSAKAPAAAPQQSDAANRRATGELDPDFVKGIGFDPARLRFDFSMSGDRTIAPERVFTDGIFTFFDFGERWNSTDLPAVYRVVDGVDTPVNTRIRGTMLIAEASGAFTLRNGQRTVCVRPEGADPDGIYKPERAATDVALPALPEHGS